MPTYEMPLLIRVMTRPEAVTTLKRISSVIFSRGGFIRKIDNLGQQPMPFKMRNHGHLYREASYFLFQFDVPPRTLKDINEEYALDVDIIRNQIYKMDNEPCPPCTLEDELLPPPYRPDVKILLRLAKKQKKDKYKFKYNSGLNYYPFQR